MITPVFAALLTGLYLYLSFRVIKGRRSVGIGLGDGDSADLRRRIRVHANCAEYAPLGLLLMLMVELQQGPVWILVGLGLMLVTGRVVHAFGVGGRSETRGARTMGMGLTFIALGLSAVLALTQSLL